VDDCLAASRQVPKGQTQATRGAKLAVAPNDFTHLHVHSEFSLLDGLGRITELVEEAKTQGFDSLAPVT
jgi:DNA polymerase III alpha subunit (gram-positive type)